MTDDNDNQDTGEEGFLKSSDDLPIIYTFKEQKKFENVAVSLQYDILGGGITNLQQLLQGHILNHWQLFDQKFAH